MLREIQYYQTERGRSPVEELAAQVRGQVTLQPRRSILDLQGMGKEIWLGMDAQEYFFFPDQ